MARVMAWKSSVGVGSEAVCDASVMGRKLEMVRRDWIKD